MIAIANVVVQSNINSFSKAGCCWMQGIFKGWGFGFLPVPVFLWWTTFISQNLGAKKYDRAKKGAHVLVSLQYFDGRDSGNYCVFCKPGICAAFNNDPK